MSFLVVFVGAGLGGVLRYAVNLAAFRWLPMNFPYGTLVANLSGSLVIGLAAGYFALRGSTDQSLRLFLTTGLLGGYTTFSAFSLEVIHLWERGDMIPAVLYVALSVGGGIAAAAVGLIVARALS